LPSAAAQSLLARIDEGIGCEEATEIARGVAQLLLNGEIEPRQAANAIYWSAWFGGGFEEDPPCEQLGDWGGEFVQIEYHLVELGGNAEALATLTRIALDGARAILAGNPLPAWKIDGDGKITRNS
jgi:hypothetical protein